MLKTGVLVLVAAAAALAQDCLSYREPVTVEGVLSRVDENGYREWIALRPKHPVCAVATPQDEPNSSVTGIVRLQVFSSDDGVSHRLSRLVGRPAAVTGTLFSALTGYHREPLLIQVNTVKPLDAAGEAALAAPAPPAPQLKDVAAYDVQVRAGAKLSKEAREAGSGAVLQPVDSYAPHRVNGGGDVVWVSCRDGYRIGAHSVAPPDADNGELDEQTRGVAKLETGQVILKMRCEKKR